MKVTVLSLVAINGLVWTMPAPVWAQPTRTIVVEQFDDAPDGEGGSDTRFDDWFRWPVLNDDGEVAFSVDLVDGPLSGLYRTDGTTTVQIARGGDPAPDASGGDTDFFENLLFEMPRLNGSGQVAFAANLQDESFDYAGQGIWIGDGTNLDQVVRSGQTAPDGNGTFPALVHSFFVDGFNDNGEVAFGIPLDDTANGSEDNEIIVRATSSGIETVAREGTHFDLVAGPPLINENGHVFFRADPDSEEPPDSGMYIWDGQSSSLIAEPNSTLSPGGFEFDNFVAQTHLNALDEVAWQSVLRDPETGDGVAQGIFRGNPSAITRIARFGDSAPDGNGGFDGTFSGFGGNALNDAGQVAFKADLEGSSDGVRGLFRGNGNETVAIVRRGDPAPDGNGTFSNIGLFSINAQGQVFFEGRTENGSESSIGLFLYDDSAGLLTALRPGDSVGIRTFDVFDAWLPGRSIDAVGFNNAGQGAFTFTSTVFTTGIGVYDPDLETEPPPPPVENCVNGIDDDGDGDVDSDDADCPDKLLVRCLHDPLFPAESSQTVQLRAQAVDQDGRSFDAAAVEVWRESDTTAPAASGANTDIVDLAIVADSDFGYSCRAEHNGLTAFSGWRRVQAGGPLVGFPANPVLFNGPFDRKVDLVFMPSDNDYASIDDPGFLRAVRNLVYEGFFQVPWFIEHQDMFNVWLAKDFGTAQPDPGDTDPSDGIRCLREPPANFRRDYLFAQVAGIVHSTPCRDNAGGYSFTIQTTPTRLQVVAHEAGHRPFGLPDEYCCDGGYFPLSNFASLYVDQPACWSGATLLGFEPSACTSFTDVGASDWWQFEPRKRPLQPQPGDLMQQTGCITPRDPAIFPAWARCDFVAATSSGPQADPNGNTACAKFGDFFVSDPNGVLQDGDEDFWMCTRRGDSTSAVWINRNGRVTYRVADSEISRMNWFLSRCLAGEC